jgi:uridine monophosphate synthetase
MNLIKEFYKRGLIKFGSFKLKSGVESPFYIDLRSIISYPDLFKEVSNNCIDIIRKNNINYDIICGVPYTALPIATQICSILDKPMILCRKEVKEYGTKKMVEGIYSDGNSVLVVDDVLTSGQSVMEVVEKLSSEGIIVRDVFVLIDREQGGRQFLESKGITVNSMITISDIFGNRYLSYEQRSELIENRVGKKLFRIMVEKQSNLCISADITNSKDLLNFVKEVGDYICMLKLHIDTLEDFTEDVINELKKLSVDYNFLLFEDRKFADIYTTSVKQYRKSIYKISEWADIVSVHGLSGSKIVDAFDENVVLLAQMSSSNNLLTNSYTDSIVEMSKNKNVVGFICQSRLSDNPRIIHMTPGVHLDNKQDLFDQCYKTPYKAIFEDDSDIIIVGRGIYASKDVRKSVKEYRMAGWEAYQQKIFGK